MGCVFILKDNSFFSKINRTGPAFIAIVGKTFHFNISGFNQNDMLAIISSLYT